MVCFPTAVRKNAPPCRHGRPLFSGDVLRTRDVLRAWGLILAGRQPSLSIEITRECPLACPGCYAYGSGHLGDSVTLRELRDYKGQDLVNGIMALVDRYRPIHLSLVGGEPLVRFRELNAVLPRLESKGIDIQIVTSAVRPIPPEWRAVKRLRIVVSIDGLQPEHDARRKPATYERILKHIEGHTITVHCTVTRQMTFKPGYLRQFVAFWSGRTEVRKIWMSLFTPQRGETSAEILPPLARQDVITELAELRKEFSKLEMPEAVLAVYRKPPQSPRECIFARTTRTVSADLRRVVTPCQFGGTPDCSQCGCIASAALGAVGNHRLPLGIRVGAVYGASYRFGQWLRRARNLRHPAGTREAGRKDAVASPGYDSV